MSLKAVKVLKIFVISMLISTTVVAIHKPALAKNTDALPNNQFATVLDYYDDYTTFDPALAYDTASQTIIEQIYEPLITYNRDNTDEFLPQLADYWEISADKTSYVFHIRPDVNFHNGASLTAEDVAYTFQRGILQGGYSSPQWLLTEPFLGRGIDDITGIVDNFNSADDRDSLKLNPPEVLLQACNTVKSKIVANTSVGTVTMTLAQPWSPFLVTLADSWGSIVNKDWVTAQGGWNGDCSTWQNYYAMQIPEDPLTPTANGTGPFILDHWTTGVEIGLVRNENYWRTTPMWQNGPSGLAKFDQVFFYKAISTQDTLNKLINGDIDIATTNVNYYASIEQEVLARYHADGSYKSLGDPDGSLLVYDDILSSSIDVGLFNYSVSPASPYIGTGTWGTGTPINFFTDIHVRKAFNYAFNWDQYIAQVYGGEALQLNGMIPKGVLGYSDHQPHFSYDLSSALAEINQAFNGAVSANGFTMTCPFNEGNLIRQSFCELLKAGVEALSPSKFHIEILSLPWPDYLNHQRSGYLPLMTGGWMLDILHPHNAVEPYLTGTFAYRQNLPQALKDKYSLKIDTCLNLVGEDVRLCYEDIQINTYMDCLDIFLTQSKFRTYTIATLNGYFHNPAKSLYVYALSKDPIVVPDSDTNITFTDDHSTQVNLSIPAGTVTEATQLVILPDTSLQLLGGDLLATNPAFVIQGYKVSDGSPVTFTFDPGIPIIINYVESPVLEETLSLYYWNGVDWEDASCGDYVRNIAENTLTVPICHLSQFQMGGDTIRTYLPIIRR